MDDIQRLLFIFLADGAPVTASERICSRWVKHCINFSLYQI